MIKLLALDLDGTTLDSTGSVPVDNRHAIREAEARGVLVTIATGRRFRDARPVGIDLALNAPLITHNGALLKYADTGDTVHSSLLSTEITLAVIETGKRYGGDPLVSVDPNGSGTLLYDRVSDHNLPLKKYLRWAEGLHGEHIGRQGVQHVERLADSISDNEVVHISFSGPYRSMLDLETKLGDTFGSTVNILSTRYPQLDFTLIDILPSSASKGNAVEKIASMNAIDRDEVMVIGDNFNDLEMLEYAGTPVVMGNADAKLLDRTEFYTTLTNDESGVAAAIDRFILSA